MTNDEIVEAHYEARKRGDLDGMLAPLAPDFEWTEMEGFPYRGTFRGPDFGFEQFADTAIVAESMA